MYVLQTNKLNELHLYNIMNWFYLQLSVLEETNDDDDDDDGKTLNQLVYHLSFTLL